MSYFKKVYARIVRAGYRVSRYQCYECGKWNGPIAFGGGWFTVKCTNPDCKEFGQAKSKRATRGNLA